MRSGVASLRSETLAELPDARIEEDFAELHRIGELLEAERLRRLAEIDRRRLFERDGQLSTASWLASRFRTAWGAAREQVRIARAFDRMHATRAAFEAGEVSLSSVRLLTSAHDAEPAAFGRGERELVEAAKTHTVSDLQRVVAFWRQNVEREDPMGHADTLRRRRRLHASVSLLGSVRVDGDLDPATGETLLTALRAVIDAEARCATADDDRTPAQRRVDALGEICRRFLDSGDRPTVAGERPHVTITVGAEALARGGPGELDHAGPVGPETARQLACDASVMRVVVAGRSEPLDVGRRTPVVPPAVRRAVIVRDRHCRFPGCDRHGASSRWLRPRSPRRPPGLPAAGRIDPGGSGTALKPAALRVATP